MKPLLFPCSDSLFLKKTCFVALLGMLVLLASCAGGVVKEAAAGKEPLFTFVLDDGNDTDYLVARELFLAHRAPMSIAVITDIVNTEGRLTVGQLKEMQREGFEIVSHTKSHPKLTSLSGAQLDAELSGSKAALEQWGIAVTGLVYPFNMNNKTVRKVARSYYQFGRSGGSMLTTDTTDCYELQSYSLKHDSARIRKLIDRAYAEKKWLIIYHHQIDVKVRLSEGRFIPGEEIRFTPSGALGRYKRDLFNWSYFVPLSGTPKEGDRATGVASNETGTIVEVLYDEKQIINEMLGYIRTKYPDMKIVTLEQGVKIMDTQP